MVVVVDLKVIELDQMAVLVEEVVMDLLVVDLEIMEIILP